MSGWHTARLVRWRVRLHGAQSVADPFQRPERQRGQSGACSAPWQACTAWGHVGRIRRRERACWASRGRVRLEGSRRAERRRPFLASRASARGQGACSARGQLGACSAPWQGSKAGGAPLLIALAGYLGGTLARGFASLAVLEPCRGRAAGRALSGRAAGGLSASLRGWSALRSSLGRSLGSRRLWRLRARCARSSPAPASLRARPALRCSLAQPLGSR